MANRKEEKDVILQRVRPRSTHLIQGSDEAQREVGKTVYRSISFVKRNRKLIEREGFKIVNPEILNDNAEKYKSQPVREQASQERKEERHSDSDMPKPTKSELPDRKEDEVKEEVEITASAAAQKLADEHGIPLEDVKGTGKNGNITKSDVQKIIES